MPTTPPPGSSFASLGLSEPLVRATIGRGYREPTVVQARVIPSVIGGVDVWASAPTGSGKTASFVLPILERLSRRALEPSTARRAVAVLIVAPTRELAAQICEHVGAYARHLETPPRTRVVFGGVSINPQMMALRGGADIVVATPGRLLDLAQKNALSLSRVKTFVIDEADRLLDRGFRDELAQIVALLPALHQTLLFSATFPADVEALARAVLNEPTRVDIGADTSDAPVIAHRAIEVDAPRRTELLRHLLEDEHATRVLVFVATTYATEHVSRKLRDLGIPAAALHGRRSQGARTAALADFQRGAVRVLVATDVAARGLDIPEVSMVVNYDLPRSPTTYVHRIGRTGRAGATGVAVSFVTAEGRAHFRLIERRCHLRLPRDHVPGLAPTEPEVTVIRTEGTGGVKGRRKSKKDKRREAAARDDEPT